MRKRFESSEVGAVGSIKEFLREVSGDVIDCFGLVLRLGGGALDSVTLSLIRGMYAYMTLSISSEMKQIVAEGMWMRIVIHGLGWSGFFC